MNGYKRFFHQRRTSKTEKCKNYYLFESKQWMNEKTTFLSQKVLFIFVGAMQRNRCTLSRALFNLLELLNIEQMSRLKSLKLNLKRFFALFLKLRSQNQDFFNFWL